MPKIELKSVLLIEDKTPQAVVIRDDNCGHQVFYRLEEMNGADLEHFLKQITLKNETAK